jgi:hypothetical protein
MTKEIKKYVAFNPSSSNADEWWTADSLKELKDVFWASCVTNTFNFKKVSEGRYFCESIEIYNVKIHPKAIEGLT